MFLKRKIEKWVEAGLMSGDQAAAILAHENTQGRPWVIFGIAGIGITTIATGIISLIAANWEDIPSPVKLAVYFLMLAGLGAGILKEEKRAGVVRESLLALFVFFQLAGIALVAQVFHLHSDGWSGLLFWLVISFPAVILAEGKLLANVWVVTLSITYGIWIERHRFLFPNEISAAYVAAVCPFALANLGLWGHRFKSFPRQLYLACIFWSFASIVLGGSLLANTLWVEIQFGRPNEIVASPYLALPWAFLALAALGSVTRKLPESPRLPFLTAVLLLLIGTVVTIPLVTDLKLVKPIGQIVGCAAFMVIWSFAAAAAASARMRRLYDFATLIISVRFIVVYFEVFGTLTTTGVGLILSGAIILLVAYFWHKYRSRLARVLGGGK